MEENITIKGLEDFDREEVEKIKELVYSNYKKISREFKGDLVLHAKKHNKDGDRAMYSFHGKIQTPINLINAEATDWELEKALHLTLNKLKSSIEHKFKK